LLNDANTYPTYTVLASVLGNCGEVYQAFVGILPEYQIELEWRYYNDGKSWLGKAVSKKKTVFWLSVWQGFFKVSFHFKEKTRLGIMNLPIADEIKTRIENAPIKGKLASLIIDVSESTHLKDVSTLISYKQSCK
jgi:hypothetical protein